MRINPLSVTVVLFGAGAGVGFCLGNNLHATAMGATIALGIIVIASLFGL